MNPRYARRTAGVATLAVAALTLAGCGSAGSADPAAQDGALTVVASTDVWGSVVEAVAGDAVDVTTLIDDPSADPHSYESTPADAAAVSDADLVVLNGGGYDEFMEQILGSSEDKPTVNAFELAEVGESAHEGAEGAQAEGEAHADEPEGEAHEEGEAHAEEEGVHAHEGGANEHVWYELPAVEAVAEQLAEELGRLLPDQAETFTSNAESFHEEIDAIAARLSEIRQANPDGRAALTEPIATYLVEDAGLTNATPPEFLQAVEEENDPPAAAVAAMRELITTNGIDALIYNPQTETPVTEQVRTDAEAAGIPVVEMTETLPEDSEYIEWMTAQVEAFADALQG